MPAGADSPAPIIRRSKLAEDDYRKIWQYIAFENPDAADQLLRKFDERLKLYADHPRMGSDRSRLVRGLRSFPVGNYLVFYRIANDGIELVRVLHGAQRLKRTMFKS